MSKWLDLVGMENGSRGRRWQVFRLQPAMSKFISNDRSGQLRLYDFASCARILEVLVIVGLPRQRLSTTKNRKTEAFDFS